VILTLLKGYRYCGRKDMAIPLRQHGGASRALNERPHQRVVSIAVLARLLCLWLISARTNQNLTANLYGVAGVLQRSSLNWSAVYARVVDHIVGDIFVAAA